MRFRSTKLKEGMIRMKKFTKEAVKRAGLSLVAAVALFTITTSSASAASAGKVIVKVNGATISMNDASAYITKENYTLVPLRFVSEALGAKVSWDNKEKKATVEVSEPAQKKVTVVLYANDIVIESPAEPLLITSAGSPATMKNNRVMVPLRVISEGLGASVGFTAKTGGGGIVSVSTPWKTPVQPDTPAPTTTPTTNSEYTTWTPTADQKVTGPVVFKPLTWDSSTRTLSFQLPSTIKHGSEEWEVTSGLRDSGKKDRKLETGVEQKLVGLSEDFMVAINIDYEPRSVGIDCYYVMSKSYASKHYGYKGLVDDGLIVYDSHKNMVTLETVYKALGIAN